MISDAPLEKKCERKFVMLLSTLAEARDYASNYFIDRFRVLLHWRVVDIPSTLGELYSEKAVLSSVGWQNHALVKSSQALYIFH